MRFCESIIYLISSNNDNVCEVLMEVCLVTGANGFVGRALCAYWVAQGLRVRGTVRSIDTNLPLSSSIEFFASGSIGPKTNWYPALKDVDVIFHLASTVHRPDIKDPTIY